MEIFLHFFILIMAFVHTSNAGDWFSRGSTTTPPPNTTSPNPGSNQDQNNSSKSNTSALVCLDDFEMAAAKILDENALGYFRSGADEEITLRDNRLAYKRITMVPRVLVDVSKRRLETSILGKRVTVPFGTAPTAYQKLATPEGEMANARAQAAIGSIFILSTLSTTSLEDVAKNAPGGRKWFQLYIFKNRTITVNLIRRAEAAGFEALAVTVDTPLFGKRRADRRNGFKLPPNLRLANFDGEIGMASGDSSDGATGLEKLNYYLDDGLTWKDVTWLKSITRLPIFLKGILKPEDADMAAQLGVQGVYVSNHGARQLDTVSATIDALPKIVERIAGRCDVVMDGGIRTGTDVFKALAFGAKMVFVGRPLVWGLAVDGEKGAKKVLDILKEEFNSTLALAGIQNVGQINTNYIGKSVSPQPLL